MKVLIVIQIMISMILMMKNDDDDDDNNECKYILDIGGDEEDPILQSFK